MDLYSQFISKSRYSRFVQEENRREHWDETVDRYFTFMFNHLEEKHNYSPTMICA
jgi:ribonucleoside-triphosphate reductase (thioredoxin)